jgi:hypothetical protein
MKKMMVALSLFLFLHFVAPAQKYTFENLAGSWHNSNGVGLDVLDSNCIWR